MCRCLDKQMQSRIYAPVADTLANASCLVACSGFCSLDVGTAINRPRSSPSLLPYSSKSSLRLNLSLLHFGFPSIMSRSPGINENGARAPGIMTLVIRTRDLLDPTINFPHLVCRPRCPTNSSSPMAQGLLRNRNCTVPPISSPSDGFIRNCAGFSDDASSFMHNLRERRASRAAYLARRRPKSVAFKS